MKHLDRIIIVLSATLALMVLSAVTLLIENVPTLAASVIWYMN